MVICASVGWGCRDWNAGEQSPDRQTMIDVHCHPDLFDATSFQFFLLFTTLGAKPHRVSGFGQRTSNEPRTDC